MKTITKFRLEELKQYANFPGVSLTFMPCLQGEENKSFALYTPSAKIEMMVNNPVIADKFKVGQEYFVEFTLIEKADKVA
jgi:hypothetical protein